MDHAIKEDFRQGKVVSRNNLLAIPELMPADAAKHPQFGQMFNLNIRPPPGIYVPHVIRSQDFNFVKTMVAFCLRIIRLLRARRPNGFGTALLYTVTLLWPIIVKSAPAGGPDSFNGSSFHNLVMEKNAGGRLEAFHVNGSGELMHRCERKFLRGWTSWSSLGGQFLPGVAVASQNGRLEVFVVSRSDGEIRQSSQQQPDSEDWTDWTVLAGERVQAPVAVGLNCRDRLELFATAAGGNSIKHIWQADTPAGWSAWEDMGGAVQPGFIVITNDDRDLELFGVDTHSQELVYRAQTFHGGKSGWSAWASLGGAVAPDLVARQNARGGLEIFARNPANCTINHIFQPAPANPARWSSWQNLSGPVMPGLAVGRNAGGQLEIFAVSQVNRHIQRCAQDPAGIPTSWTPWVDMQETTRSAPAVEPDRLGRLELLAFDETNENILNYTRQIKGNLGWEDWWSIDQPATPLLVRTWQSDEGLPDNRVQAITQTPDGYLWVGTGKGVARFDGVQFTTVDIKKAFGMKSAFVTALCSDRSGAFWIGSDGGGLARLGADGLSLFTKTNGLTGDRVMVICESRDGSIWIGATTGVSHYQNGKFTSYTAKDGLVSNFIRDIHEDSAGNIWIATAGGLNCLNGKGIKCFGATNGLPAFSLRKIFEDDKGRLWIGSDNGMILWHDHRFYTDNTRFGLANEIVSCFCEDEGGNLLAGTYNGLNQFREGCFINEFNSDGLPFGRINTLFRDRSGILWAGTQEGLCRLVPKRFNSLTTKQGLTHNNVMSVLEDHSGNMWLGTWGGGLDEMRDGQIITCTAATNGLFNDLCLAICEDQDGSLWIGEDFNGGLAHLKNGHLVCYNGKDGLLYAAIRVIHEDRSGNLWIGTSLGLSCLKQGKFINYTVKDGLTGDVIRAMCEDQTGRLWIGTDSGLCCWWQGHFERFTTKSGLSDNLIRALYEDAAQNLWIGTGTGGLNRYKNGHFTAYTTREGLFSDEIFAILEDDYGCLWMSCSQGIFRVEKQNLDELDCGKRKRIASIAYGKADGMVSTTCSGVAQPAGWKSRDGRLWFATSKGLISFNPGEIKINKTPPPVYVEQVNADRTRFGSASPLSWNVAQTRVIDPLAYLSTSTPIQIPSGHGRLEFHYTALELQTPEKIRFRYRLEGVDSQWIDAQTRRAAYYENLSPGTYIFQVMADDNDGYWHQAGTSLAIVLLPYFWQTWWFETLLALAIMAGWISAVRYLTGKKLTRKLKQLEQQNAVERERSRIARDMHDDLGARLSEIVLNGRCAAKTNLSPEETRRFAGKMTETARELVDSLDAIVWAVNPKNDSLDKFADYISEYVQSYLETAALRCSLDIPAAVLNYPLSSEARHNLYLVTKEALHNIVKHAQASHVRFHLRVADSTLFASIEDDGRGFIQETGVHWGNGLESMASRIQSLGGSLDLLAHPGAGTRVHFQIPLAGNARFSLKNSPSPHNKTHDN
jgi:ligand-binding sensor domain-containing protein/signal transduction histidine kinase